MSNLIRSESSSEYAFHLLKYKPMKKLQLAPHQYKVAHKRTILDIFSIIRSSVDVPGTVTGGINTYESQENGQNLSSMYNALQKSHQYLFCYENKLFCFVFYFHAYNQQTCSDVQIFKRY